MNKFLTLLLLAIATCFYLLWAMYTTKHHPMTEKGQERFGLAMAYAGCLFGTLLVIGGFR